MTLALTFIGLPFVVRTLQPVIAELDPAVEEAAASLGATRAQTLLRVVLPALLPAWLTGFALAFARALGEYGSVVFIAGNMPMRTEITSLLIITKLEQYDYAGATAIALVMLLASFAMLLTINVLQALERTQDRVDEAPGPDRAAARAFRPPSDLAGLSRACSWCCRWWRCSPRPSRRGSPPTRRRSGSRWP